MRLQQVQCFAVRKIAVVDAIDAGMDRLFDALAAAGMRDRGLAEFARDLDKRSQFVFAQWVAFGPCMGNELVAGNIDLQVIDGIVNGVGSLARGIGTSVRYLQNGNIGFYLMSMVLGVVFIVLLTFLF